MSCRSSASASACERKISAAFFDAAAAAFAALVAGFPPTRFDFF
ncbi:hypothetical protein [Microterricola viridarii]|nr:hypothetical protein [Microterricola viridarii]